jgi:hypothetical protein
VTLGLGTNQTPLPAKQILYRTTDATGNAVASVTTVVLPAGGTVDAKVVAYLSFYDALGSQCDPSYTLRGGNPGAANEQNAQVEQGVINSLHQDGYIVTVPDFEDETLDYVAGTESGMSSLDNLAYVNGSPSWSDVIPAAMIGISRSYHLDLTPYLSAYGRKVVAAESNECIGQFLGAYPHLTLQEIMKPQYADITQVPVFRNIMNQLIMGSVPGHPREPLLMVAGKSDGTGDGVMVEGDEQQLAYEYCHQGVPVSFQELQGMNHDQAGAAFMPQAFAYLAARFAGAPPPSNCPLIPPANPLTPSS